MPIDIASGNVSGEFIDLSVPGKVALVWQRRYSGALIPFAPGALGRGWTHSYASSLTRFSGGFRFITPSGATELLADADGAVERGGRVRHLGAFFEIFMREHRYVVQTWDVDNGEVLRYIFKSGEQGVAMLLDSVEDVSGQGLDLEWDESRQLRCVRQRLERRELDLSYNRQGLIDALTLVSPNGERHGVAKYEYDAAGRLVAAYDAADFADRFAYDEKHRWARQIIKDGGVFSYRYDGKGRCVLRTGLNHYDEKRLRYLEAVRITEVTNSYGATSRFLALPTGQIVGEWSATGAQRRTEYDEHGRISTITDSVGGTTRYGYDEDGNRAVVVDALEQVTHQNFTPDHLPQTLTDAAGQVWQRHYDVANRLVASVDPDGHRWVYEYDDEGNVSALVDPLGARISQTFDAGILSAVTDWIGNRREFEFDAFGRVVMRRDAMGEVTRIRYDDLGRPIQIAHPDGSLIHATYDHAGNLTRYIDPNGSVTRWRYGPCNRLMERVDPIGNSVRYVWGSEQGRLDEVINSNGDRFQFFRDDGGRVVREISFDGRERRFEYNGEDRVTRFVNGNGEAVVLERDLLHRIVAQVLPDGDTVQFRFSAVGLLEHAQTADIAIGIERDAAGRVTREVQGDQWVRSRYDAAGRLIQTTTSLGLEVGYKNDGNGGVVGIAVGGQVYHIERNAHGHETARTLADGLYLEQRFDSLGRMVEQVAGDASVQESLVHRRYLYDPAGQLRALDDARWGRTDYVYDPAERLIQTLKSRGGSESFEYDSTGNITHMRAAGAHAVDEARLYAQGDQLIEQGDTRFEYDAEGRLIRKTEHSQSEEPRLWTYQWNALDRLKSLTDPDGQTWRYGYDALARRVSKERVGDAPALRRTFLWDKERVIHEADAAHGSRSAWVYGDARYAPLLTVQNGQVFSIVLDQIGTPRELISPDGRVALSRTYTAWGTIDAEYVSTQFSVRCPVGFQGQWRDEESGLCYNKFRYYAPESGRYISQDPLELLGGANFYAYGANPVNWLDPLGLCASHDSGKRGTDQAEKDLIANDHEILAREVTMVVNGQRVRADFVTRGPDGVTIHVFEVKNGTGRLTPNQDNSGVYNAGMDHPANSSPSGGGTIDTKGPGSKADTLTVATGNPAKTTAAGLPAKGGTQPATFSVLKYDV
ncbi:RHS repeat-associated core domain-containing protein [Variovorax rhizosphaerae]|uniref:RHS repeat-associated core domain-containing protein n=1 Tax=Variovorax rhizosphaerae TaxID=1836200 RepID=A0ABU8WC98_9BURK